ncbi:MAG: NADH-ubiquinone oxidoreductase-F iron-sulfur binding region domain-containing protein, partial [Gemmataceae bacterium]
MIIQELNLIQERCGYLPEAELRELSERINQPLHRLHEVASFYPLYRLEPPPTVDVKVCRDMACHLHGAPHLQGSLEAYCRELDPDHIEVGGVSCLGQCDRTIPCVINDNVYWSKNEKELRALIGKAYAREPLPHQHADRNPLGWKIDPYNGQPAYEAIKKYVADRNKKAILEELETSHLRGMGGAGFPTFRKWSFVLNAPGDPKYVVCNADESEPGTFKDRELLRRTPHLVIEGMTLAGLVTGAQQGWLYLRHEYHDELEAFQEALEKARTMGVIGDNILGSGLAFNLDVYLSPGGYIQGEETALLEAMEDRRGEPRNKPPFPVTHGLFNKPTVINNVETLAWVPGIIKYGGAWYRDGGTNGASGMRFVSISGDVNKPGVYEVPFGQTVQELVFETAGGMRGNQRLLAIAPSGPSGGFLPAEIPFSLLTPKFIEEKKVPEGENYNILNLPLDLNTLGSLNGMLGAAFVVYGHRCNIVENALNCVEFFRNESCGKCVPCRLGSQKLVDIIKAILLGKFPRSDLEMVNEVSQAMTMASICGLGQVASNPIASVVKYFR